MSGMGVSPRESVIFKKRQRQILAAGYASYKGKIYEAKVMYKNCPSYYHFELVRPWYLPNLTRIHPMDTELVTARDLANAMRR